MSEQPAQDWPDDLPRFAESFRILIDHPKWDRVRLLNGDWTHAMLWLKVRQDFCPLLAHAGRLGFIACTSPIGVHTREELRAYYGNDDFPAIYWHWRNGAWQWPDDAYCAQFAAYRGVSVALMKLSRNQDVPAELRS